MQGAGIHVAIGEDDEESTRRDHRHRGPGELPFPRLEAVVGADSVIRGIVNDWFGNAAAYAATPGAPLIWNQTQFLASGPAAGWSTPPLDGTKPLHEILGYHSLTLDPTGYFHQG